MCSLLSSCWGIVSGETYTRAVFFRESRSNFPGRKVSGKTAEEDQLEWTTKVATAQIVYKDEKYESPLPPIYPEMMPKYAGSGRRHFAYLSSIITKINTKLKAKCKLYNLLAVYIGIAVVTTQNYILK